MIVGATCMAHSAVEGGQVRSIVRPERRRVYRFFYTILHFFNIFFRRDIVATILFSFYTLSISIRTVVVERGVYVIVPISLTQDFLVSPPHVSHNQPIKPADRIIVPATHN